jgi:hypothetical protein
MLYFAYGSNLDVPQMNYRCPKAEPLGAAYFPNWKLVFRGVADIEPEDGAMLPVGIWDVTDDCLIALDRYEGVSSGLYRRVFINGMLTYRMNNNGISAPSNNYFNSILRGYDDFGLDKSYLFDARHDAVKDEYKGYSFSLA